MRFHLGVDVGSTFTDLYARGEDGSVRVAKVPSSHPEPAEAVLTGIGWLFAPGETIIKTVLGTTAGLNAVLERRGAKTALITSTGFRDVYRMARGDTLPPQPRYPLNLSCQWLLGDVMALVQSAGRAGFGRRWREVLTTPDFRDDLYADDPGPFLASLLLFPRRALRQRWSREVR